MNIFGFVYSHKQYLILQCYCLQRSVLSVFGKDKYAVFPLNGKLLNVREAGPKRLLNNATIQKIINILGLQVGNHYQDVKELRYGHLMIMVTQVCTNNCALTISSICLFIYLFMLIEQHYMCFVVS